MSERKRIYLMESANEYRLGIILNEVYVLGEVVIPKHESIQFINNQLHYLAKLIMNKPTITEEKN